MIMTNEQAQAIAQAAISLDDARRALEAAGGAYLQARDLRRAAEQAEATLAKLIQEAKTGGPRC
jgi:hypothetical protein